MAVAGVERLQKEMTCGKFSHEVEPSLNNCFKVIKQWFKNDETKVTLLIAFFWLMFDLTVIKK